MEERKPIVHEQELAAIQDSRERDMPIFVAKHDKTVWVVAVSDHQARLALVDYVWPVKKLTKRVRDDRYTELLEAVFANSRRVPE